MNDCNAGANSCTNDVICHGQTTVDHLVEVSNISGLLLARRTSSRRLSPSRMASFRWTCLPRRTDTALLTLLIHFIVR